MTGAATVGRVECTRWRRNGKDRLYVRDPEGTEVGWWDLASDEPHPALPELLPVLADAVASWRVAVGHADAAASDGVAPGAPAPEVPVREDAEAARPVPEPPSAQTPELPPTLDAVDGVAGASAASEFQRRHDRRQERVQANHPKIGRFLLAVFDDPQSTKAWSSGAQGEARLGTLLEPIAGPLLRVLHDRRLPRSSANIDHLVVCPTGVYVIDAKRYVGKRPRLRIEGGILRPRTELLLVGGRDRTLLVEGLHKQLGHVRAALAERPDVPVRGVLCFVDADWPLIGGDFVVRDVSVLWPKRLKALLAQRGPLDADAIAETQWRLHEAFPRNRQ